ncbi:hypothetical protein L2E82_02553 [Cichorium intybus]|uniref:Uncharacterized protein n=1 Tax=Cichorium intybus TaxID=13427 RepID=A0ACB9H1Z3_CICIN|nr:hypothetical protein L2E82_02553 [Cichorium intybus]
MSVPLEHDYIGLSEPSSMDKTSESSNHSSENALNLKATELRLGLPGLGQDLEKTPCKNSPVKSFVSGAKRGFSDVNLDGSCKWGFNGGSDGDSAKGSCSTTSVLFGINTGLENKQTQPPIPLPVEEKNKASVTTENGRAPPSKAQVVGWPPIRSFRKNTMASNLSKNEDVAERNSGCGGCLYVKVSMDGAPYLRKVDLKTCKNYSQLSKALEKMFGRFTLGQCTSNRLLRGQGLSESNLKDLLHHDECVLTYEDKDGDWMLVGDVPWEMFVDLCKRLRIMKGSEAIGLAPRFMEKSKNQLRGV